MKLARLNTFADFAAFRLALINTENPGSIHFDESSMDMAILQWAFDGIESDMKSADDCEKAFFDWRLDMINCAGCHAPDGLIYNHDIAAKFPDWWNEIDEVLDEYFSQTGERFTPESCGHLVWFAVEYRAHDLASMLRDLWELES